MTEGKQLFIQASAAYSQGDFKKAFGLFRVLAENGDENAMSRVAAMYFSGQGTEVDFTKSIEWDLKAVRAGSHFSMYNLGVSYRAVGNCREARDWFEKALARGHGEAALQLAKLYMVSDQENARVKNYLQMVINARSITRDSLEEATRLMQQLNPRP